jgi:hypothetical protein
MRPTLIFLLLLIVSNLWAESSNTEKVLTLRKVNADIIVDGIIDDIWSNADSVDNFVQFLPHNKLEPTRRTVAKILSTDKSLFCLIIGYDLRENIETQTGKLDDFAGDMVSIMLDTFGDKRSAYKFAVSASGVRSDSRMLDDARNRDYSWDGIWFADGKVYDWGYVVEIEIPYKSIQYDVELNEWGLDFDRWIPNETEDIYWCSYDENEGQRISKFGKLVFDNFKPEVRGLNLEIYPVGIAKIKKLENDKYKIDPNAGLDVFYNPSPKLAFQFTANPDFAQIEADPFDFNISRYESYFSERRPFFTEGREVFQASGKERGSGFYSPLELFYSRRIGKKLPNGDEVPLIAGAKAFGRLGEWEYGGFTAITGEKSYNLYDNKNVENQAYFGSVRLNKQILENSSVGVLFVGKHDKDQDNAVFDLDGAFRSTDWQLAYQLAGSYKKENTKTNGGFASSFGLRIIKSDWMTLVRSRIISNNFDVNEIGFVPWQGYASFVGVTGPRWYFETGSVNEVLIYGGATTAWEKDDDGWDYNGILGFSVSFRSQWQFEVNLDGGKAKELDKNFDSYTINFNTSFHTSPKWNASFWGGYTKTYNYARDYLAFFSWQGGELNWKAFDFLNLGTNYELFVEGNPEGDIEDITYNARPYFSLTPVNDLNIKMYVDNVFVRSSDKLEQVRIGFFFAYNFSPKSWIYFAFNEVRDRSEEYNRLGNLLPARLHSVNQAAVLKIKYLYYL